MAMFGDRVFGANEITFLEPCFCPYRCMQQVLARDYEDHIARWCTHKPVDCPDGCGELVPRYQHPEHRTVCPIAQLLDRAELSLRESALAEMRTAIAGIYKEKEQAWARIEARGSYVSVAKKSGFPIPKLTKQVAKLEVEMRNLTVRLRKRAQKRLTDAMAFNNADSTTWKDDKETASALRYWDTLESVTALEVDERGARPWDMVPIDLAPLTDALRDAAVSGVEEKLRRGGEQLLIGILRRKLEAAMGSTSLIGLEGIQEALAVVQESLRVIELSDASEVFEAIDSMSSEIHVVTLREIGECSDEFHEAVTNGDVDLCRWFFEREQASPDAVHPRTRLPPIVYAAKTGDLPMCRLLIKERADIDARCTADGLTALHWSVHNRTARAMSLLLEAGANPRLQDKRGQDALMKLVRRDFDGPAPTCELSWLLDRAGGYALPGPELPSSGARDIDEAKVLGEGDPACVGFVVNELEDGTQSISMRAKAEKGKRPPTTLESADGSVAYIKVKSDNIHDLRELLSYGADAGATDMGGLTALHHHQLFASGGGSAQVVSTLLRHNADVNVRDDTGRATTPYLLAVSAKRADLVKMMIREAFPAAEVDTATADNVSALELAENMGPSAREVVDLLRSAGASSYQTCEMVLGKNTVVNYDSRLPLPP